jgi:hypothetical protein
MGSMFRQLAQLAGSFRVWNNVEKASLFDRDSRTKWKANRVDKLAVYSSNNTSKEKGFIVVRLDCVRDGFSVISASHLFFLKGADKSKPDWENKG